MARRLWAAALVALLAAACTAPPEAKVTPPTGSPTLSHGATLPVTPAKVDPLCRVKPTPSPSKVASAGTLPPVLAQVAHEVEQVRGLSFLRPVPAEPVTRERIAQLLRSNANASAPKIEVARTSKAWATIGVIPRGTDLFKALLDFDTTQVLGFYDPDTHRLVFIGSASPTPFERFTLSHELTHALDDQRFSLSRLNTLQNCHDDEQGAYISLAEGDAVSASIAWAQQNLTAKELLEVQQVASSGPSPPASVPRFLVDLQEFPYGAGPRFIQALLDRGGGQAVNDAFRHPPVSTEQILHPERYPSDRPVPVEVADVGSKLGSGWKEIEIEQVGEAWLQLLLAEHLSQSDAKADTDHWGGGQYRAWSNGSHTVVVMDTSWDDQQAAARFAQGIRRWLGARTTAAVLQLGPKFVRVLFSSDAPTFASLRRIAG